MGKMELHLREQTRLSNAAQDRIITDEARFRSLKVIVIEVILLNSKNL